VRRSLLEQLRSLVNSSIRVHFAPLLDRLMDENVLLGVQRVGVDSTRSLAFSGMGVDGSVWLWMGVWS
jgi:hypothetical protein